MVNCLICDHHSRRMTWILSGVKISVKSREVAARDLHADAVTWKKEITGRPQIDVIGDDSIRSDKRWVFGHPAPPARADDTVLQVARKSVRPDIKQPDYPVGIAGRG